MYYRVLVASQRYHKSEPLTYQSEVELEFGSVVEVALQNQLVLGIITEKTTKPKFKTKPISSVIINGAIPPQSIKLLTWLAGYYPSPLGLTNSLLIPSYLLNRSKEDIIKPAMAKSAYPKLPRLTADQTRVIKSILAMNGHSALLHGDTGVGKTRIYMELAKESLGNNRSVVVLTPEIGLTPQLLKIFFDYFGGSVYLLHSGLTPKQRRRAWLEIASAQQPLIVIGPRSALFSPLKGIGLIVVDEMHDGAYKQEQAPYFQTTRVAGKLAELHQAKLVLGSATPPVTDYYVFKENDLPIYSMKTSAISSSHGLSTEIIDLKDRSIFSRNAWLSDELIKSTEKALGRSEQILMFLNRRGSARSVVCSSCGWRAICPRCDLPLTYHGDTHRLICHTCGHNESTLSSCPVCGSNDIIFKSAGTKAVATELERLFPKAIIKRFDSDLNKRDQLQSNFEEVKSGKVDILVGTQMLGKGLDLPKLSVVGVVLADTSLNFPDYTAEERTYQLLNQVIGRVGRGHLPGKVIIQTYYPDSKLIKQALHKDYENFYLDQIKERQQFRFPPFCYILKLSCSRRSQTRAQKTAHSLLESLAKNNRGLEIIGPSPAFSEKAHGNYTWQLIIKSTKRSKLTEIINNLPANWNYDIDPVNLL